MRADGKKGAGVDTPNGAGSYIRMPNTILVHGTEGYSIEKVDSNGYLNKDLPLAEDYILIFGFSHTKVLENLVLFILFAVLLLRCFRKQLLGEKVKLLKVMWQSIKTVFLFSSAIEILQMFLRLGTF